MQDVSFLQALIAGLLSFLSPCVLPLVPPYLCYLAGTSIDALTAEDSDPAIGRRVVLIALSFVLGFTVIFVSLGAAVPLLGDFISAYKREMTVAAGIVIILMGLHFLGVFRFALLQREARFEVRKKPAGPLGAFVMGLAFAFGWTPCAGPMLGTILFIASGKSDSFYGASLLFTYSLGIGIPFLLAALFVRPFLAFLNRFRRHMATVEKVMGALLVITGVLFLTGAMESAAYYLLELFPALGEFGYTPLTPKAGADFWIS